MRRARFTEGQIIELLKQADETGRLGDILREQNITKQLFRSWQKAYGDRLTQEDGERPSRAARTREAGDVNQLGLRLAGMSQEDLDQLDLPEELREAIDLCQSLKIRGRVRQKRRICRLLREADHEGVRERVAALDLSRARESG